MILVREAKLYPNKAQEIQLGNILEGCRLLYNKALENKISFYEKTGKSLNRFALQKQFKGKENYHNVPASIKQMVIYRLDKSFSRFFTKKASFPRFRTMNRYRSFELRSYGIDYRIKEDKLRILRVNGLIKTRGLTNVDFGMGRIIKRASGWYLQYTFEVKENPMKKRFAKKIGIDLGLTSFLVDSEGVLVKAPQFFRKTQDELARVQRRLSKAIKYSNRRKKKIVLAAKLHERIANQRKDWLHKLSMQYAKKYDLVAVEDLNVKGMVRNHHLAKSISDAGWSMFVNMLAYKLKMLGRSLVKVAPHFTSQECSQCGELVAKSLSVRTHICNCGFIANRDYNAALNILKKAQHGLTVRTAH